MLQGRDGTNPKIAEDRANRTTPKQSEHQTRLAINHSRRTFGKIKHGKTTEVVLQKEACRAPEDVP